MLQGYAVTVVAWLYWSRYVSSRLASCGRYVASLWTGAPPETPREDAGSPLKKLMVYMQPYLWRFVAVLCLVVLSSYGEKKRARKHSDNSITVYIILYILLFM